ncbi:MAG: sensor histidine kinase [Clostridia bacterium]|nr:sensor histidine kinase [Clostridia bacterium]
MKNLMSFIDNLTLRTKLVITYVILITIPILLIGWRYYTTSTQVISDIAEKNTYELVKKNNEIIDVKLTQIMNNISSFITDKDLVNAFEEVDPKDDYSVMLLDNKITNYLNKYFLQSQDIYSAQLATSYFVFGPRSLTMTTVKSLIPKDSFINSGIYSIAKSQSGKIQWIPTYDFGQMFDIQYLKDVDVDYKYMFSAAVEVNGSYYENGVFSSLSADIEKPVLILNFKEDFFQQIYKNSLPIEGSYFFVATKDGRIVSHQDQSIVSKKLSLNWLSQILSKENGTELIEIDGKKMIVCYSTSKVTGWISAAVIPPDRLVEPMIPVVRSYTIYVAIGLTLISILLAYFMSIKITNPISKLAKAIKRTGEGNFDLKMKEEGSRESRELIHRFNIMNEKIQKLIEENYETKIKEKEAEITALSLQLDPHFMYNTLNLINLISMENGQEEISEMLVSLSTMLKYTVKARKDLVPFKEDMDYLKSYIFIMTKRFEDRFAVEYDIDPALYSYTVPKFLLQPFIENSLIHGFEGLKRMGILKIRCWIDQGTRYYCVEDNGKGMTPDKLNEIMNPDEGAIGINNIDKRVKILYGNEYGVKIESELNRGTTTIINMPV